MFAPWIGVTGGRELKLGEARAIPLDDLRAAHEGWFRSSRMETRTKTFLLAACLAGFWIRRSSCLLGSGPPFVWALTSLVPEACNACRKPRSGRKPGKEWALSAGLRLHGLPIVFLILMSSLQTTREPTSFPRDGGVFTWRRSSRRQPYRMRDAVAAAVIFAHSRPSCLSF